MAVPAALPAMVVRAMVEAPIPAVRRALTRSALPSVAIVTLPSRSVRYTCSVAPSRRAMVCRFGWP
jgi:hypothetical protein